VRQVVLALLVALSACSVSRPAEDATGEEIYSQLCTNCHGADLEGGPLGPAIGPGSNAADLPDAFLEFTIIHGRGSMPSFKQVLNDAQVERLIQYMREVQDP